MIANRRAMLPVALGVLVACHVGGVLWLKLDRASGKIAEHSEQLAQIGARLDEAQRAHSARAAYVARLRQEGQLFPAASAEDTINSLRRAITQALPGIAFEVGTQPGPPTRTSAGLSLLPVTISSRIPDETLIDTIRLIEGLRPRLMLTRVFARPAEARRTGPATPTPMADVTLSGYIMVAAPGAKP
ncbi:MAG: hypothetical protein O9322_05620 [Beijerinckiaceae bacterium]|nr:hypothetical protein [Beijerinckiaceae bacterium]MCZ8299000.1 hypothetical protein [Beijerinckiaceae bacterium]